MDQYLLIPGAAGHNASTPDSSANSPTGNFELMSRFLLGAWPPANQISPWPGKWNDGANQRQYMASIKTNFFGTFELSTDGTGGTYKVASTNNFEDDFNAATILWARVTFNATTGAIGWYVSDDQTQDYAAVTWGSAIGSDLITAGGAFNGNTPLIVGGVNSFDFAGRLYRSLLHDGDSTVLADFNANDADLGDGASDTFNSATTGEEWTINGAGSVIAADTEAAGGLLLLGVG